MDILGQVAQTVTMRGSDRIPDEVFEKLRESVFASECYKALSHDQQREAREQLEKQIAGQRGISIREASAKSLAALLRDHITRLEPLEESIIGLAQTLGSDNQPHVFALGGLHADLQTALMLLERVEQNIVHMVTCECGKEEKKPGETASP